MSINHDDDEQRYVEYFQKSLLTEGSENFVRAQAARLEGERKKLEGETLSTINEKSYLDCYFSEKIFSPLIKTAIDICKRAGVAPDLAVHFANSPGLEPTAAVLPSTIKHIIFAGHGTSIFCSYWAKIFSEVLAESAQFTLSNKKWDAGKFKDKILSTDIIPKATSLALWYASHNTLVGYGKLKQEEKFMTIRVLLLNAMEIFIIGHEISHLSFHEAHPATLGVAPGKTVKDLEIECDGIGLVVCTVYGIDEKNTFATNFIGPLVALYSVQLCENIKEIITKKAAKESNSHPPTAQRIENVFSFVESLGLHKDILKIMTESFEAIKIVGEQVELLTRLIREEADTHSSENE